MATRFSSLAAFSLAALALSSGTAFGMGLKVSPIVVNLQAGQQHRDISVQNDSKDKAYIQFVPLKMINPGTKDEERVPRKGDLMEFGLTASPAKMVLKPGQKSYVRVVSLLGLPKVEHDYILNVTPAQGQIVKSEGPGEKGKAAAGIRVSIGFSVLVLVRPAHPSIDMKLTREGKTLTVVNNGNVSIVLKKGQQCDSKGTMCKDLPLKRVYAGETWSLQLPYNTPAHYKGYYIQKRFDLKSN